MAEHRVGRRTRRRPAEAARPTRTPGPVPRLRIDPTACDGVGICAHVAASLISVDMWGFPILAAPDLDERTLPEARAAVRACPHRALFLD